MHVADGVADGDSAAYAFATALGFETVHLEHHLVLGLPVDAGHLDGLRASVADRAAAYDVVTWGDRCPDEYAAAYCAMKTQMSNDVPVGEVDYEPIVYDEERLRSSETRTARSYHQLLAAARRADGTFGGYTQLYLPHGETDVIQDDTLVMPRAPRSSPRHDPQAGQSRRPPARPPRPGEDPHLDRSRQPRDVPHQPRLRLHRRRAAA